ncbi:hypothetical protein [Homoserinimonas hongtaonis]|uniref:hypothetical protein n=1 Tax=Homoserinimonas hongtaonis TaxID=2079791 RepID=UPI000D3A06BC|nr:hypothetical protein [Salinibacterium hongtaonis]AWB88643.1 hypothetical protein C2138_02940 [Salinibacterium hongtaonis]
MTVTHRSHLVRVAVVGIFMAATGAAAIAAVAGASVGMLLLIAPVPWAFAIGARKGVGLAVALPLLLSFWALGGVLAVTAATNLPMLPTVITLWTVIGLGGAAACASRVDSVRLPSRAALAAWLPALLGAAVWLSTISVAGVLKGSSRISWVMSGDSANNLLFAREVVYRGGIVFGPLENPVPLTSALLGASIAAGRDRVAPQQLLAHDLESFAALWALLIALLCVLSGAVAASIVRAVTLRPVTIGIVAAGASCLPLTWFVSGYPIEFGFFNTAISLVIVLAAFLAFLSYRTSPALVLAAQAFTATLLLAVWSPLVLLPASLGFVTIVFMWRELLATRRSSLWLLVIAIAQLIVFGLAVVLPSVVSLGDFLKAQGAVHGFRTVMLPLLALAAVGLALFALKGHRSSALAGTIAIISGSGAILGVLLFISRNEPVPWTYYPLKFAWLASVILIVIIAGLLPALALRFLRGHSMQQIGVAAVMIATLVGLVVMPKLAFSLDTRGPLARIIDGDFLGDGDSVARQIVSLSDPDQSHLLWQTGQHYETAVNFWLMMMWADSMKENFELRAAAYGLEGTDDVGVLCRNIELMGGRTVVHSRRADLQQLLHDECSTANAQVVQARFSD